MLAVFVTSLPRESVRPQGRERGRLHVKAFCMFWHALNRASASSLLHGFHRWEYEQHTSRMGLSPLAGRSILELGVRGWGFHPLWAGASLDIRWYSGIFEVLCVWSRTPSAVERLAFVQCVWSRAAIYAKPK